MVDYQTEDIKDIKGDWLFPEGKKWSAGWNYGEHRYGDYGEMQAHWDKQYYDKWEHKAEAQYKAQIFDVRKMNIDQAKAYTQEDKKLYNDYGGDVIYPESKDAKEDAIQAGGYTKTRADVDIDQ